MIKTKPARCDELHIFDPQFIGEVAADCLTHMFNTEKLSHPNPDFILSSQTEITERMRSTLMSWLVEVHLKFKLLPETLFIAINLIDRFTQ